MFLNSPTHFSNYSQCCSSCPFEPTGGFLHLTRSEISEEMSISSIVANHSLTIWVQQTSFAFEVAIVWFVWSFVKDGHLESSGAPKPSVHSAITKRTCNSSVLKHFGINLIHWDCLETFWGRQINTKIMCFPASLASCKCQEDHNIWEVHCSMIWFTHRLFAGFGYGCLKNGCWTLSGFLWLPNIHQS